MTDVHPLAQLLGRRTIDVPCTIEIEQTPESLHAHVDLKTDVEIAPGDEVTVHGDPVEIAYGDKVVLSRRATILKAGPLDRIWTRLTAWFELTELYEVSFSSRRRL